MRRALATVCLALACAVAAVLAPVAAAAPAKVDIGTVRLATTPRGHQSLLVPVAYPIEMAGRRVQLTLGLHRPGGPVLHHWTVRPRANAGSLGSPERRLRFTFVHRIDIGADMATELRGDDEVIVSAVANLGLGVGANGKPRLLLLDGDVQPAPLASGGSRICATPPELRARPGRTVLVPLPLCNVETRWALAGRPERGSARIRGGKLVYRAPQGFRGTAAITLSGRAAPGAGASVTPVDTVAPVQITVGSPEAPVVRALGDSVTAGFGYYDDGSLMGFTSLLSCKPGAKTYDDACSSNSTVRTNKAEKVEYAADYGLANNVSWVAQWANAHGVTDFKNYAVSGSEPSDWFGKGQFAATTKQLASEKPDYVLLTVGANPLLSNMLFGIGNIGCGIWADAFGRFQECIEEEFAEINLRANLKTLYANLVKETKAQIFVMQYHLSIPTAALYTATQIAEMGNLLNEEINTVAKEVSASRITVVAPPHFNTGLDIAPAYPAEFKCVGRFFTSHVDGRSVQSSASQTLLQGLHPFEFCSQAAKEKPWVISGDTGIHPSAEGYAQMAAEVPAPK